VSGAAPPVLPLGEAAWTVVLGDRVNLELHRRVTDLAEAIRAAGLAGVIEVVPAYAAVTVFFDPLAGSPDVLREELARLAATASDLGISRPAAAPSSRRLVTIPVRYGGPDLALVAAATGLPESEVIRRHAQPEYRVYLLGFAPGWAYLGDLDPALVLPRRKAPRTRVPAGSVAIAGAQTGVYPLATPGGWHLIGSTSLTMFDPAREPAALLRVGDRVRFLPSA
jgi:KipI family sensor histidine kinase inhibitor